MMYYKHKNGKVFAYKKSDIQTVESIAALEVAKDEAALASIDPVFFAIRDNIAQCDLMTPEEIEAHLNPPRIITAESLKAEITALRWQHETGGLTLPSGVRVATGIDDQNRITSVITNAELAGVEVVDFKAASGWVSITVAELKAVAAAIALHVQQCFTSERVHHEAIDALAAQHAEDEQALQAALQAYDTEQGWPSNNATQGVGDE